MNLRRAGATLSVATLLTTAVLASRVHAQEETDAPPALLKGGIVHQLRSLTEDAKSAFDNSLNKRSNSGPGAKAPPRVARSQRSRQSAQSRPAEVESAPVALPPQPTGRATLQRTHSSPWVERQKLAQPAAPEKRQLPEVVRPEEIMKKRPTGKLEQAGGESLVHVESQIPQAVRESFRAPRQQTPQRPSTPQSNSPRAELTSTQLSESRLQAEPATLSTPRVSRVPLPNRPSTTSITGESRLQPQSPDPASLSLSAPTRRAAPPSTSTTSLPASQPAELPSTEPPSSNEAGSVSVPTRVTPVPAMERSSATTQPQDATPKQPAASNPSLPALPSQSLASQAPQTQELPTLPSPSLDAGQWSVSTNAAAPKRQTTPPTTTADQSAPSLTPPSLPTAALPKQSSPAPIASNTPKPQPQSNTQQLSSPSPSSVRSDRTRMTMITPRVQVQLNGPGDIPVAKPARYEIVVNNQDSIDLNGLLLQLDCPAGVKVQSMGPSIGNVDVEAAGDGSTLLSWTFEKLPAGQQATAPLQLVASSAQNFAVAMEWTLLPVADLARVAVRSPRLELALEGPSQVDYGKANTYRLVIRNPGNAPAKDVKVALTAQQYGQSSSEIGDIAAGGEESIDVELTFNQQGNINIAAAATADAGLSSQTTIDVLVRKANLNTSIASPTLVYHGSETPVVITVANTGNAVAEQVKASLVLPAGAKLDNAPPYVVRVGNEARWTIAKLAPGEKQEIPVGVTFTQSGDNTLTLSCSNTGGLSSRASATTAVEAVADLILLVNDPPAPAPIGSEVAYTLKLTNRGSKAAKDVKVITQFSDGIEPSRGSGMEYKIVPGQLFFEPIDSIAAGETIELKVFAKAQASGMHRFRAEVRTSEEAMRLVQEEATKYMNTVRRIASPSGSVIR